LSRNKITVDQNFDDNIIKIHNFNEIDVEYEITPIDSYNDGGSPISTVLTEDSPTRFGSTSPLQLESPNRSPSPLKLRHLGS